MHQSDQGKLISIIVPLLPHSLNLNSSGVFKRMVDEVRKYILSTRKTEGLQVLDMRMTQLLKFAFLQNFRLPTLAKVWESGIKLQANEYRSIMQIVHVVLRGFVTEEVMNCFVLFWHWYNLAARTKVHCRATLQKLAAYGER